MKTNNIPSGTITFLFTDIEGLPKLIQYFNQKLLDSSLQMGKENSWVWWYHHPMTTATAQASPNIAFIKLVQWNTIFGHRKACFAQS